MSNAPKSDPYQCSWCGKTYVVPALARACEEKHR